MSLCPISSLYPVTFTGVRADDGGDPEEVTVTAVNFIDYELVEPAAYDKRLDNTMTFDMDTDGVYAIFYVGNVTGTIQYEKIVVNHNAKYNILYQGREDVDNMICGKCSCSDYQRMKALLPEQDDLDTCQDILNADSQLKLIAEIAAGCGDQVKCTCGC